MNDIEKARSALNSLDPSCSRDEWVCIGMAVKAAGLPFEDFHTWSKEAINNYSGEKDCLNAWKSFSESGGITAATLFHKAIEKGWRYENETYARLPIIENAADSYQSCSNEDSRAFNIWEKCLPAEKSHPYILQKQGKCEGLRYYPATELSLPVNGVDVTGFLVVPCWDNDELQTLQFIPPYGGKKLNLGGTKFNDGYFVVGQITDRIYLCEGISAAWAVNKASGAGSIVCFGASRMNTVAKILRIQYPLAALIIVSDKGQEGLATKIAEHVAGISIEMPYDKPANYDACDFAQEYGCEKLNLLLTLPPMPLNTVFAAELSKNFEPVDELVEGVLVADDASIVYGDSNSGKTFFVIDMACAIARGIEWMGRKTEPGLVIYLAAESPASVKRRLQAYQKHHGIFVPNFAIVQSPIDLFSSEHDTEQVISLIRMIEKQFKQKVRLVVGDTLARLIAGANENAGQDMGLIIRRADRIRRECKAHFMLIHHNGKNVAAGARGWSGIRAAVDTEIEITDSPAGRCAEITKQRDLSTKGIRIGFKLEIITLGLTKWKSSETSCVVIPMDAPPKSTNKRVSEVGGAIIEHLRSLDKAIKKPDLVKHFKGVYTANAVYKQLRKLVDAGLVTDIAGYVKIVPSGAN
jgi:putative DNA primase/helicase